MEAGERILGCAACLAASTLTPLGLILQKYAHAREEVRRTGLASHRQPWWIAGIVVFLSGHILNIVSMGLAPQVILSCLGSWAIVPNGVFAWFLLRERLNTPQILYMGVMVVGMMMVVLATPSSSSLEPGAISPELLAEMFIGKDFVAIAFAITGMVGSIGVAIFWGQTVRSANVRGAFWLLVATTISGFATTICKCVSLLATHAAPQTYLATPHFYCMILAGVLLSITMLHCINMGLQEGDALIVVPLYYALGMLFQILVAGTFFNEFNAFSGSGQTLLFTSGVSVLLLSIGALPFAHISSHREKKETEEELLAVHG